MWATLAVLLLLVQSSDHAAEGLKALGSGEYETAAEAFRKAVAADPSDYSAHFNLALAYGFLARDEDGIAEYRRTPPARGDRRAPAASTYRFRALLRRPCASFRRLPNPGVAPRRPGACV